MGQSFAYRLSDFPGKQAVVLAWFPTLADNEAFAKATSVKLGDQVVTKKEADFQGAWLRRHAMHQTASAACTATAGHIRTPAGLTPAAAVTRTAPAAQL